MTAALVERARCLTVATVAAGRSVMISISFSSLRRSP